MQRPEYQKVFAISQSIIKAFVTNLISVFKKEYIDNTDDEPESKFAFGSLVDTIAFTPKLLDERFYIPEYIVEIPGEKVKNIIDRVFKEARKIVETKELLNEKGNLPEPLYIPNIRDLYEWNDLVLKHAKEENYGNGKWGTTRILDSIQTSDNHTYFMLLNDSKGRHVINSKDNTDAVSLVEMLQKDPNTAKYFIQQEGEELIFQQEIFVDYPYTYEDKDTGALITRMIPLKGALDIIHLDHINHTVRIPDLKTSENMEEFGKIARNFGYVIQVSFYQFLLMEWLKTYKEGSYKDYTVLSPLNITVDRSSPVPYVYEYGQEDLEIAENGSEEKFIKGWRHTLDEICWHMVYNIWDRPKELHQTGSIKLKIFR